MRRPRFVTFMVVAALGAAAFNISRLAADRLAGPEAALYLVASWGLWSLKPWARMLAMAYLGYLLVSFLLWGVRGLGGHELFTVMAWQILVLPVLTFCFMYLYNGRRYFTSAPQD